MVGFILVPSISNRQSVWTTSPPSPKSHSLTINAYELWGPSGFRSALRTPFRSQFPSPAKVQLLLRVVAQCRMKAAEPPQEAKWRRS